MIRGLNQRLLIYINTLSIAIIIYSIFNEGGGLMNITASEKIIIILVSRNMALGDLAQLTG